MRIPSGSCLLLAGSGIYWILSSQLIASFTVLTPQVFLNNPDATTTVLTVGILACAGGLWAIKGDLEELVNLLNRGNGWLYLTPLLLASCDLVITLTGISSSRTIMELNPLVASAIQAGPVAFTAFAISYMALSAGLTLLMLDTGRELFPSRPWKYVSLALVCGAASFGLVNNFLILVFPVLAGYTPVVALTGSFVIAEMVFSRLKMGDTMLPRFVSPAIS